MCRIFFFAHPKGCKKRERRVSTVAIWSPRFDRSHQVAIQMVAGSIPTDGTFFFFSKRFDMGAYSGAKRVQTIYTMRNHIKGSLMNLLNTRVYLSVVASGAKRWYSRQIRDLKDIAFLCKSFARKQFHFVVSWHFWSNPQNGISRDMVLRHCCIQSTLQAWRPPQPKRILYSAVGELTTS